MNASVYGLERSFFLFVFGLYLTFIRSLSGHEVIVH